jgi:hypothetical protein
MRWLIEKLIVRDPHESDASKLMRGFREWQRTMVRPAYAKEATPRETRQLYLLARDLFR